MANVEGVLSGVCVAALIVIAVVDERTLEIPPICNWLIGIAGGIHLLMDLPHVMEYVAGMCCVSGIFMIVYWLTGGRAIGGGDIKLMAAAGLFLGWKKILLALLVGFASAAVIHCLRMRLMGRGRVLALGPYLAFGIFTAMLYGSEIITWYSNFQFFYLQPFGK